MYVYISESVARKYLRRVMTEKPLLYNIYLFLTEVPSFLISSEY